MTRVKRGEIYWILPNPYRPALGHVQRPGRPGIVVSNDANNNCSSTAEIVYLTMKPKTPLPTHCTIKATGAESTVLCEQITTVSINDQIGDYMGTCTPEEMAAVERCMAASLGLNLQNTHDNKPADNETEKKIIDHQKTVIETLKRELEKARHGEEVVRGLYIHLLEKVL